MKRLEKNRYMLYALKTANPQLRKSILKNAPPDLIKTLSEIAHNVLQGNVEICNKTHKCLCKYKRVLRKFSSPHYNIEYKRRLITNQTGGWMVPLMSIVGTLLSNYLLE